MVRYYIDTCIWRDLIENRSDRFRSLGEDARGFFQRCAESGGIIVWSPLVEHELHHPESQQAMNVILARNGQLQRAEGIVEVKKPEDLM